MAVLQTFGILRNIISFWHKFTTGSANGMAVRPVILYGTDGEPYTANGGGGGTTAQVYGNNAQGTAPSQPPVLIGGIVPATGFVNTLQMSSLLSALTIASSGLTTVGINYAQLDDAATITYAENQFGALRMSSDRSLIVTPRAVTGANSSVAGTVANSTQLLAVNNNRKGATITNDMTGQTLYISLGAACTPTNYSVQLIPGDYYEVPYGYVGIITGVFSAATGSALITEMV